MNEIYLMHKSILGFWFIMVVYVVLVFGIEIFLDAAQHARDLAITVAGERYCV